MIKNITNCIQKEFQILNINIHQFNYLNVILILIAAFISSIALLTNNYQSVIASKIIGLAIVPFISLCIMLIGGSNNQIWKSATNCTYFILLVVGLSMIIGYVNEVVQWKPDPTPEMMTHATFKYENIWLELIVAFVAGIGVYFAILKTSTIALIGLVLVISIVPVMCNAGLFWGMYLCNSNNGIMQLSKENKIKINEKSLYLDYGKRSFVIFLSNITGLFLGFLVAFLIHCII